MPLISNWPREERTWAKLKASHMYNNTYYLRRTKSIVYQLATNNVQIVNGIGIKILQDYVPIKNKPVPKFPDANLNATNLIASIAFIVFTCLTLSFFFSAALFFDLFWPERIESPAMQRIWKLGSFITCVFQFAASLAITLVVALGQVGIHGVASQAGRQVLETWQGKELIYKKSVLMWVLVGSCWVQLFFVIWSAVAMWRALTHNNKYGPFNDHRQKDRGGNSESFDLIIGVHQSRTE